MGLSPCCSIDSTGLQLGLDSQDPILTFCLERGPLKSSDTTGSKVLDLNQDKVKKILSRWMKI